jgi:hypothetical protein
VWPFLIVIDLDEATVRCRLCRWTSPTQATVEQARLVYAAHTCTARLMCGPFLGWCAVCGRVRVRGLRPVGPPRPRAWVHTWVCANGCPSKATSVVGDPAGAWGERPCPQAPARHSERPGGPA